MDDGDLIRQARLRAGLSQGGLARRLGTRQPAVSRWERGVTSPSLENVRRAVAACGLRLDIRLEEPDAGDDALIKEWLRLPVVERVRRNEQMLATEAWVRRALPVHPRARG